MGVLLAAGSATAAEKSPPVRVLIAYHSEQGHTAALARAVEEGARRVPQTEVRLKRTREVRCEDLRWSHAVIVGSPVYWNNMSGEVKTFFDRWTTECQVLPPEFAMRDKIGAAFSTGGEVSSGKEIALLTILAAMIGNRMIVVSEGQALGATATTGEGKQPLAPSDLEDGRKLGERVARVAHTFHARPPSK
jgi:NAD(P)H dehydrogenase (quinone)